VHNQTETQVGMADFERLVAIIEGMKAKMDVNQA
jgi:hypothetical protein